MNKPEKYHRFSVSDRIEHWVLTASFALLAVTGMVQLDVDLGIASWVINLLGGIETVRLLHHLAAIVMMLETIYHLGMAGYKFLVLHQRLHILPGLSDLRNAFQGLRYNLGLSKERALQGRYTFEEKIEYWAVVWGTVIMGITGFMLWNPIATTHLLPGDIVPAAKAAHGKEALLAVLAILIWHLYHVHIRHLNKSMFDGKMTEEEMLDEHPVELADIRAGRITPRPDAQTVARRRRFYLPAYGLLSLAMLAGVWFFVGFEKTAITTVPPAEDVVVYAPLTPTPLPTLAPTPTLPPATPTATGSAAEATAVPAAAAEMAWQSGIGDLIQTKCVACHSGANKLGGLDLTSYQAAMAGGISGAAIVPGEAPTSLLFTRQASGGHPGQFSADELAQIEHWLEIGAPEALPAPAASAAAGVAWQGGIGDLIQTKCAACHSGANKLGGLDLSSYQATMAGGISGAAVVPGEAPTSLLFARQASGGHPGQFSADELAQIEHWLELGAPEQ